MSDGDCLPRGGRGGGRGGRGGRRWNITSADLTLLCLVGLRPCYYPKHNYSPFNTEQIMRSVFHLTRYGRGGGGGGGHQSIGRPAPSPPGWLAVARQLTPEVLRWYSRIFNYFIWACWLLREQMISGRKTCPREGASELVSNTFWNKSSGEKFQRKCLQDWRQRLYQVLWSWSKGRFPFVLQICSRGAFVPLQCLP